MSIRHFDYLFRPRSVALIGASSRAQSIGTVVLRNLLDAPFRGRIFAVNPKYRSLSGLACYRRVEDLPEAPDLAVICTPPNTVPGLIAELGTRGTKAAAVLTAGLRDTLDASGRNLGAAMLAAAKPHLLRVLGPNCVGLLIPSIGLNASFAHTDAVHGNIAFVSQSGGMVTAVLDWAKSRGIGFSKFISIGDRADVDFADVIDYLARDPDTHSILLYIESIKTARSFMSAARAAARGKPVVAVKAGRVPEGARAVASHTGALAGSDEVYDAAFRRAGMLRVFSMEELFDSAETLARARPATGDRLAILSNGGGPAVMATDALVLAQGRLASLCADTVQRLDRVLPANWSRGNPVDIVGDAPVDRYVSTLRILLADAASDALLFIHAPSAVVPSEAIAEAVVPLIRDTLRNVLACWLGADSVALARRRSAQAGIPSYDTPEQAVRAFLQIVEHRRNQELLLEVPASNAADFAPERETAAAVVQRALESGAAMLPEPEAKAVLTAYGIPAVETRVASSVDEAAVLAGEVGFPVAVKILSPDVVHKSDVGGVALDLETEQDVRANADAMARRLRQLQPGAHLRGFAVQPMVRRPGAHELIIGVTSDAVFGPVILFGQGGLAVEAVGDRAIGLPPLNAALARELIAHTRVARLLAGYRNRPPVDLEAIGRVLVRISQLLADIPEIVELDVNPLLADERGALALDARMRVAPALVGTDRFSIRPYPQELEEWTTWQGQALMLRAIRPEDAPQHAEFFAALQPEDVRYRAFAAVRELQPRQLARLTQIDYDREMAFVATREREPGCSETLSVVRVATDPDNVTAELAIIVRSDLKSRGLGSLLLKKMIDYCRSRGTQVIVGDTFAHNTRALNLVQRFGFAVNQSADPDTVSLRLELDLTRTDPGRRADRKGR